MPFGASRWVRPCMKGTGMAKRGPSGLFSVLKAFLHLTIDDQWEVIRGANDHGKNAISTLISELSNEMGFLSVDEMIASHGQLLAEAKLERRQRPANLQREIEI